VRTEFPIISELYKIFNTEYDVSAFVSNLLVF
jgi:glycerol-3-phosphate dehydrogenase